MKASNPSGELAKNKPEDLAESARRDSVLLATVFEGMSSSDPKLRYKSAKILNLMSQKDPGKLYPKIDFFINLLDSDNSILKWNAIDIMANLASADADGRFEEIFGKFYGLLQEGSLITAGHVVANSWKIVEAKPHLENRITEQLLKIEKTKLPTEECTNILIGHAILCFGKCFDRIQNKDEVITFMKRQMNNSRNATKAKAEKFLKKHPHS
jgi:hypothetical protein